MNRQQLAMIMAMLLVASLLVLLTPVHARAMVQDDPRAQCAEGMELFREGRVIEALPLLEAGFVGRERAAFALPDDLGKCALILGLSRDGIGDWAGALEAYTVALEIFQDSGNRLFEEPTLYNTGLVYIHQGRFGKALESFQRALAIARETGDRTGEGRVLNGIGAVYDRQGHYHEALDTLQQAMAIASEVGNRVDQGHVLASTGKVYSHQGHLAEALEVLLQALTTAEEMGDRIGAGHALDSIGQVYHSQGRDVESLEVYQRAIAIYKEARDQASEASTLNNIGMVYADQGRYDEALRIVEQALAIARAIGDRANEGTMLDNMGSIYCNNAHYAEALEAHQQALVIRREVGDRAGEGQTLSGIGWVYYHQGRYGEALEAFQQALTIAREVSNQHDEGATLSSIGAVYRAEGLYAEAFEVYQQVLVITKELGNRANEGRMLTSIGAIYRVQGHHTKALETHQQALTIQRELGDRAGEGQTLANIGFAYYTQGQYAEALDNYQQALAILREVGDRDAEGTVLGNIGALYQRQGEPSQALAHYEQAMEIFESIRAVAGSEVGRAGFIAQRTGLYDDAVGLYHQQHQDEAAFHASERGRARAFLDSLAAGYVELSDQAAADLLAREQETYTARQAAQDALVSARAADPLDPMLVSDLEVQLAEAKKEHAAALAAIETRHDQLAALVPGRSAVRELADVQALLDDQSTLVAYYVLGDEGTLAFVITHDSFNTVELRDATPNNLGTALTALYQWLNLADPYPQPLQDLHAWLVAPLTEYLRTPLVGIIPHRSLHYVPFAALTDGQIYFGQQHPVFTLPSASALPFIQANALAAHGSGALIFGDPTTGDASLQPLAHAAAEAKAVADLLGVPAYTGADASEARLRSDASGARVVHLAAHGGYNTANPLYSTIYLAPGGEDDGRLEVHEVYGLDLKAADLAVLSACESQVGELSAGDELVGLTRAFFFAGTPTVVASLWPVDDAATEELMVAFYRHWRAGMGKAEALQAAQAEIRQKYPSPFYWAGFVLSGDPGVATKASSSPSELESAPSSTLPGDFLGGLWPWAAACAGILLVSLGWWVIQRRRKTL